MQVSGSNQNVVKGNNLWKSIGKGAAVAGKMVAGGTAGIFIGGIGLPAVWAKDDALAICRDAVNLVTGPDADWGLVPSQKDDARFISLIKLIWHTATFFPVMAFCAPFGAFVNAIETAKETYEVGLRQAVKDGVSVYKDEWKALNKEFRLIKEGPEVKRFGVFMEF